MKLVKIAAAALLVGSSSLAIAGPLLDDFSAAQFLFDGVANGTHGAATGTGPLGGKSGTMGSYSQVCDSSISLGGCREVYVQKTSGPAPSGLFNLVSAGANTTLNRFSFNSGDATNDPNLSNSGFAIVRWDGTREAAGTGGHENATYNSGLIDVSAGADLMDENLELLGTAFQVTYNADISFQYVIEAWDIFGNTVSQSFNGLGGSIDRSITISFDDFSAVIDTEHLAGLQVVLNTGLVRSLDVNFLVTEAVPEPGTITLAGMALVGLAAAARRRRSIGK